MPTISTDWLGKDTEFLVSVLEEMYTLQDIFPAIREDTMVAALGEDGYQRMKDAELELAQTESGLTENLKAVSDVVRDRVLKSDTPVESASFSVSIVQPKPKYDVKLLDKLAEKNAEVAACKLPDDPYTRITRKRAKSG